MHSSDSSEPWASILIRKPCLCFLSTFFLGKNTALWRKKRGNGYSTERRIPVGSEEELPDGEGCQTWVRIARKNENIVIPEMLRSLSPHGAGSQAQELNVASEPFLLHCPGDSVHSSSGIQVLLCVGFPGISFWAGDLHAGVSEVSWEQQLGQGARREMGGKGSRLGDRGSALCLRAGAALRVGPFL